MKKITQNTDDLLLDYLDGKLQAEEYAKVSDLLAADPEIKNRFEQLKQMHHYSLAATLEQPSAHFTESVMKRLQEPSRTGVSLRNGLALLLGIIVVTGMATWLLSAGVFDRSHTRLDLSELPFLQKFNFKSLPSIAVEGRLVVNIIILLNLALALILLDRVILKPLFQRRSRAWN
jgi:anti-sigma factor RsiW